MKNYKFPALCVRNLKICATIEHPINWSVSEGLQYALEQKHNLADYLTDILNKRSLEPEVSMSSKLIDFILSRLRLEIVNSEIRYDLLSPYVHILVIVIILAIFNQLELRIVQKILLLELRVKILF